MKALVISTSAKLTKEKKNCNHKSINAPSYINFVTFLIINCQCIMYLIINYAGMVFSGTHMGKKMKSWINVISNVWAEANSLS